MLKRFALHENLLALVVFIILLALIIFLRDATPVFIYQGF
jgi:hypothetical protein